MASVKERAAALNLEEKLIVGPQTPYSQGHEVVTEANHATALWSGLICHLKTSVTVKHRRIHLKAHSNCFVGSDAMDVVMDHLSHASGFEGADVSRDKTMHVCQTLLNCNAFEAVDTKLFGKDRKQNLFQDSKNALYRFLDTEMPPTNELERDLSFWTRCHGIHNLFCCSPSDGQEHPTSSHGKSRQRRTSFDTPGKARNLDTPGRARNLDTPGRARNLDTPGRANQSQSFSSNSPLPQSLVDEVWHEQTMLRLLKVVDLPMLDGLLQCSQNPPPSPCPQLAHNKPDLIYSSSHLDRQILKSFRDSQEDEWLCAALDCLDSLPDQPVVELSRELPRFVAQDPDSPGYTTAGPRFCLDGTAQGKLLIYEVLVKHYSHTDRPALLPKHMSDVYTAIVDLLVNAKLDKALEALQLCLKLLSPSCREELRRLLTFMALAADPGAIKLDKEIENRLAVMRSFCRAILHSRKLSTETDQLMMIFMIDNRKEIFKIPGPLHKQVSDMLDSVLRGTQPDVTGSTFCQQVPSNIYLDTSRITTNQHLWYLLKTIHHDPQMSAKEKKRLLGQFHQAHPVIFNEYFGDSAVGVL